MQGKGEPLPLQPIPKTKTNSKIKVVYTEDLTHPWNTHLRFALTTGLRFSAHSNENTKHKKGYF
jgi:hypothetical protein